MDVLDIIRQVDDEKRNRVIVRWAKRGATAPEINGIKSECWTVTIANDPDVYFSQMDKKYSGKATLSKKIKLDSIDEGVQLCKALYSHFGDEPEQIEIGENVDSNQETFLCIHIHFLLN